MDPERIPNGSQTDPERIPNEQKTEMYLNRNVLKIAIKFLDFFDAFRYVWMHSDAFGTLAAFG